MFINQATVCGTLVREGSLSNVDVKAQHACLLLLHTPCHVASFPFPALQLTSGQTQEPSSNHGALVSSLRAKCNVITGITVSVKHGFLTLQTKKEEDEAEKIGKVKMNRCQDVGCWCMPKRKVGSIHHSKKGGK